MALEIINNNGTKYIRIVENKYVSKNGKPSSKKIVLLNVGPLSRFDDGKPDFEFRLKESFKNGNPIIPALLEYVDRKPIQEAYDISIKKGDPDCIGHTKLFSNALIERIMEDIGLNSFVSRYKAFTNYEFDLLGFVRLLVYGRILNPASKIATMNQNNYYYSEIIKNIYEYNVYDTLDFLYNYRINLTNWINKRLINNFHRTTNVIYYDVTNFFFEIDEPDDFDSLRKMGVSKENRKQPIVQMGLFMDEQGIPISIESFPGNTLDHLTMQKSLKNTVDGLNLDRFIFVGDRGMYKGDNTYYLVNKNNGYIISKSLEKTAKEEKQWAFDPSGYTIVSKDFKYKSHIVKRKVKVADEYKEITEKVIVYFSKKFYDKQMHQNKSFLEFIEKLKISPDSFKITKTQSNSLKKFLKSELVNSKTGEILNSKDLKAFVDFDKINKYKDSFGYYQIVTSELDMPDQKVIDTYHGLSQIEDQFRVMKGDLETRPIYVRTNEHIHSHLLICLLSLIILRIIQNKIKSKQTLKNDKFWNMGLSGSRIQTALNKWTVSEITNGFYRFNDIDDKDLKLILDSFEISIEKKLYKKMELLNLKTSIKVI
jgi:transposase